MSSGCGGKPNLWKQSDFPFADAYPFAAKIVDPFDQLSCSGVLLTERTVLTAAHCFLREGSFIVLTPTGATTGREVARLGNRSVEDSNDLVMVALDEALPATQYPSIGRDLKSGETLTFLGFGCRDWERADGVGGMQVGSNKVVEVSAFAMTLSTLAPVRGLVGEAAASGLCYGDSGGPAFREGERKELVGIGHGVARTELGHYSLFSDLTQPSQRAFLKEQNDKLRLGIVFLE